MAKSLSLVDLIILYGNAKASSAWEECKAEERGMDGNGLDEAHIRNQKAASKRAERYLDSIRRMIGTF